MPRRPRGSVIHRGEGRYQIIISLGQRRYYETFHGEEQAAHKRKDALLVQMDKERLAPSSALTVGEYIEQWLDEWVKPPRREESTYRSYKSVFESRIRPGLGGIRLAKLTIADIETCYARMEDKVGAATIRKANVILKAALKRACRYGLIAHNPALDVEGVPKARRKPPKVWDAAQLRTFLRQIERHPLRPFILTLAFVGCRINEAAALKWDDIDFVRGYVRIDENVKKYEKRRLGDTKSHQTREVPMHPLLAAVLRAHRAGWNEARLELGPTWNPDGLLFTTSTGRPIDADNFRSRIWWPLLDEINTRLAKQPDSETGLSEIPPIKPHGLRHTFVTIMLDAGDVAEKDLAEMVGHASVSFMLDTYDHPDDEAQKRAIARFGAKIGV